MEWLKDLGIGLSRLLRYAYPGFLLAVSAAIIDPIHTKTVIEALTPTFSALAALAIGAALYVFHRRIFIPIHHAGLCALFSLSPRGKDWKTSPNPVKYLEGKFHFGFWTAMRAYTVLRSSDFFDVGIGKGDDKLDIKRQLDLEHAEHHLLIFTFEGMAIASGVALSMDDKQGLFYVFLALAIIFLAASYPPSWALHSKETHIIKRIEKSKENSIARVLFAFGMVDSENAGEKG